MTNSWVWITFVRVAPILGFLLTITIVAELADAAGVFEEASVLGARGARGSLRRLWILVVALASVTTMLLSRYNRSATYSCSSNTQSTFANRTLALCSSNRLVGEHRFTTSTSVEPNHLASYRSTSLVSYSQYDSHVDTGASRRCCLRRRCCSSSCVRNSRAIQDWLASVCVATRRHHTFTFSSGWISSAPWVDALVSPTCREEFEWTGRVAANSPERLLVLLSGTNLGPPITIGGSLASLLWRERCRSGGVEIKASCSALAGLLGVPLLLLSMTRALWLTH
jgi:hypothetical protein